MNEKMNSKLFY